MISISAWRLKVTNIIKIGHLLLQLSFLKLTLTQLSVFIVSRSNIPRSNILNTHIKTDSFHLISFEFGVSQWWLLAWNLQRPVTVEKVESPADI